MLGRYILQICYVFALQSDGGSAVLLMEESKAKAMGYKPKAYLRFESCGVSYIQLCL